VLGDLGAIRNQAEENPDVEGPLPQLEEQPTQGIDEAVPISKELVWKVQGTAGLSCGGQVGKLTETLGNIVDEKYGEGCFFFDKGGSRWSPGDEGCRFYL
jgi:hypothetical protein